MTATLSKLSFPLLIIFLNISVLASEKGKGHRDALELLENAIKLNNQLNSSNSSATGKLDSITYENYDAGYYFAGGEKFIYDLNGNVVEWITYSDSDPEDRMLYEYDLNGYLVKEERQVFTSQTWNEYYKYEYSYSGGRVDEIILSYWNPSSNAWRNSSRRVYSYISADKIDQITSYSWNNSWIRNFRHKYSYTGNNPTEILEENYDNGSWVDYSITTYTYNGSGLRTSYLFELDLGSGWQDEARGYYTYTGSGLISNEDYDIWRNYWHNESEVHYSYDGSGNTVTIFEDYSIWDPWGGYDYAFRYQYEVNNSISSSDYWVPSWYSEENLNFPNLLETFYVNYSSGGGFPPNGDRRIIHYAPLVTGIEKSSALKASVHPNPARNWIRIEAEKPAFDVFDLHILDLTGKTVIEEQNLSLGKVINIESLDPGVYWLRINTEDGIKANKKVVIR